MNAPTPKPSIDWDAYYRSRPDTRPKFRWPVWGFHYPRQPTVAVFFGYYDAVDFINSDERTLFIGEPMRPPEQFTECLPDPLKGIVP